MPDVDIVIPDSLRTRIGRFASQYYAVVTEAYESRESDIGWLTPAVEWTEETAEEYGWEYIGKGGARLVVKIPSTAGDTYTGPPLVLKLPIFRDSARDGRYQNASEANLWEKAPEELRPYLVPTLASGPLYRWVLMPYAEEVDQEMIDPRSRVLVHEQEILSNEVKAAQNWGMWNGDLRLIDYGHDISSYVLDRDDEVPMRDYVPEQFDDHEDSVEDNDEDGSGGDDQCEKDEEGTSMAETVVLYSMDIIPAEKYAVRKNLVDCTVVTGQILDSDDLDGAADLDGDIEIEVLSTKPSTTTAFGANKAYITEDTRIRFD